MKFACPESQKRVSLKCGSIDSVSAMASLGGPDGSFASGDAGDEEPAVWLDVTSAWDCARATGVATPPTKERTMTTGSAIARQAATLLEMKPFVIKMKMKLKFNLSSLVRAQRY
jgi:hypothetical protein